MKTPIETMTVSECCGATPTDLCNEDTGFCFECRDHTEFVAVCVECSEENCLCPDEPITTPYAQPGLPPTYKEIAVVGLLLFMWLCLGAFSYAGISQ